MKTSGYSLWLVPQNNVREELQQLIDELARVAGSPTFVPHITVIGGVDGEIDALRGKAIALAASTAPFKVYLYDLILGDEYHTAVTLNAYHMGQLSELNRLAQTYFRTTSTYRGHLSLAYGKFTSDERLGLVDRVSRAGILGHSLHLTSIELWRTEGKVSEWRMVDSFEFLKKP
jgi:hypothetical protein